MNPLPLNTPPPPLSSRKDSLRLDILRPPHVCALPAVHEGPKLLVGAPLAVGDVMIYDTQQLLREEKKPGGIRGGGCWMFFYRHLIFEDEVAGVHFFNERTHGNFTWMLS